MSPGPGPGLTALEVADLRLAGAYIPAGEDHEPVAGDFWDVLPVGDLVSLLVGDVSGHGVAAVDRMRALRSSAHDVVQLDPSPGVVLERLDGIMQALGLEDLATLWCGLYDPASGLLRYSSAGHPPPAVWASDGGCRRLSLSDAPPLGTGFVSSVPEHQTTLERGSVLVAYSDGLIERQYTHFDDQFSALASAIDSSCSAAGGAPDDIAASVVLQLVPEPEAAADDVCVLVVHRRPDPAVWAEEHPSVDDAWDVRGSGLPTGARTTTASGTFEPELISTRDARRFLRRFLTENDAAEDLVDTAELALAEVTTNAVLHAHTPFTVSLVLEGPRLLRVQVRDSNPQLPVQRGYAEQATTGRGLELVAAYSRECGVEPEAHGKSVWFVIAADQPQEASAELHAAWDIDLDDLVADSSGGRIALLSLPATLWLASREHHDAVLRELALYAANHRQDALAPERIALADQARALVSTQVVAELERRAAPAGSHRVLSTGQVRPVPDALSSFDLEVPVPAGAAEAFATLQDVLDIAESLARRGLLLARPALPEIIAVRDWACEQAISQLAGVSPAPWPGTSQERFTSEVHDPSTASLEWDVSVVVDAEQGVVAADDANRIIAVSRPLAAALGWDVEDLVGRRIVVLIPPELREAHVAGFTRHLTTGETHVVGVPLRLPVLRADGTRVQCHLLIERTPTTSGRAVYLARIDLDDAETARPLL